MIETKLANRYEILRELGRGGMGVVYLAYDPLLEREVAIKLISATLMNQEKEERFRREARIVAKMDHPAIVPVYDIGEHEGALFFVMPFVPGVTLRSMMRDRQLGLVDIVEVGIQVAEALDYSHSLKIIHRDIKPENIMVARGDELRVRITDYGIAKASFEKHITQTGALVGTIAYLSPELVAEEPFDHRVDIYSLGAMLYECLCGETPFTGKFQAVLSRIVNERPLPLQLKNTTIDDELAALIMQCLEKSPDRRPQRGREISEALICYQERLPQHEGVHTIEINSQTYLSEEQKTLETAAILALRPVTRAFIGREREFAELQRRLSSASAGESQFITISGEAGVGKTRLLEKFATSIKVGKSQLLRGRFIDQDRAFPYQGFCEILQDYFRASYSKSGSSATDFSDLANDLATLFPVLAEIEQLRNSSLTGSLPGTRPTPGVDFRREQDRTYIFELLARSLIRIGGGKLVILILEDLHAADVSLDALQYVVRRLASTPTLIIATYRSTEIDKRHPLVKMQDGFRGDRNFVSLALEPFTVHENRLFLESMFSEAKWDDQLIEQIYQATEGNPYFIKELIQSLIDSGKLVQDEIGDWTLSHDAEISSDTLPETIQQTIERRIERLNDDLRDLLSVASVLGKSFEFRDLKLVVDEQLDLDDAIEQLVRNGFLEEDRQTRSDKLLFSSGVMRDVLYAGLSRRKRRSLHRKYAEELERRFVGRPDRIYAQLVHHYSQADIADKVIEYGLKLAKRSLDSFSSEDAIWAARLVLEFLDDNSHGSRLVEGEARLLLGAAHQMAGNIDLAIRELEEAIKIFQAEQEPLVTLSAMVLIAETAWEGRKFEKTRIWVEQGLAIARTLEDCDCRGRLLTLGATVANLRGDHERAKEYLAEADLLLPENRELDERSMSGGKLVVAVPAPMQAAHPVNIKLSDEAEVLANVYETLMVIDATGNLVPHLCERWEVLGGGRVFQFNLRADLRRQDNQPLVAADIKVSFERAIRLSSLALPAAFAAIEGVGEFLLGEADSVVGITIISDTVLAINLREPLPIYPALLSDHKTAIACEIEDRENELPVKRLIGTGPFKMVKFQPGLVLLERYDDYWKGKPALLDAIEFRTGLSSSELAEGFRVGNFDLVRDLALKDLEAMLRDRALRMGLIEAPKKNIYFVLFNQQSSFGENVNLRKALSGSIRTSELVRNTLGRFALPAEGLFPPGVIGHEPGRRRHAISRERANELLTESGLSFPIELKVAIHPLLHDRYGALVDQLLQNWAELGVKTVNVTVGMSQYLESSHLNEGIDLMIGRWTADYDDPDNFTFGLFHSEVGQFRRYYSSAAMDELIEAARGESRPANREMIYHKIESYLLKNGIFLPLFHDIDFRVANPSVRRLALRSSPPYANYLEIRKTEPITNQSGNQKGGGLLNVPVTGELNSLDPSLVITMAQAEMLPTVFETLTRQTESARIVPWLVSQYRAEAGSRRYWFRLREDITFHDGRRLTARDVRYSFEHLLQNSESESRWLFSSVRGAKELLNGERNHLIGLQIRSEMEFTIDLEQPISFFPALLAHPSAAIMPEGMNSFQSNWREGCVGTGPFRVLRFNPGHRLELEANPYYWRPGYPKCDGLNFTSMASPVGTLAEFRAGRFSIVSELLPVDVEALRHDAELSCKYRETPSLSTYFIAFNINQGAMANEQLRRRFIQAIDVDSLVRRTLGRLAIPAHSLTPPGLLGYEQVRVATRYPLAKTPSSYNVELTCVINPIFEALFSGFTRELTKIFLERGLRIRIVDMKSEYRKALATAEVDIFIGRWIADYPDADSFINGLLHSERGAVGKLCGSAQLDRLIEEGRSETNLERRHNIYREIEHILAQNVLMLPLFHEQVYRFARPEVEGFEVGLYPPLVSYEKIWLKR